LMSPHQAHTLACSTREALSRAELAVRSRLHSAWPGTFVLICPLSTRIMRGACPNSFKGGPATCKSEGISGFINSSQDSHCVSEPSLVNSTMPLPRRTLADHLQLVRGRRGLLELTYVLSLPFHCLSHRIALCASIHRCPLALKLRRQGSDRH
jgi:hypothetical protein